MITDKEQRDQAVPGIEASSSIADAPPAKEDTRDPQSIKLPADAIGKLAGQMKVLGLSGLRKKLGENWDAHRDTIRTAIENITSKHLSEQDTVLPVQDGNFLIIFASANAAEAEEISCQISSAICKVLIGDDASKLIRVTTEIGRIEQTTDGKLTFQTVDKAPQDSAVAKRSQPSPQRQEPKSKDAPRRHLVPTEKLKEKTYKIAYYPIWNMRREILIGYGLVPVVKEGNDNSLTEHAVLPAGATDEDVTKLDTHLLKTQIKMAKELHRNAFKSLLLSQLHFRTLSCTQGRQEVMNIVSDIPETLKNTLMLEIVGIPEGTPPSTVAQRAGSLSGAVGALTIRIPQLDYPVADCVDMKATAVAYKIPAKINQEDFLSKATRMITQAKAAKLITSFEYPPNVDMLAALKKAGAVISSGTFLGGPFEVPGNMKPITLKQIRSGEASPH